MFSKNTTFFVKEKKWNSLLITRIENYFQIEKLFWKNSC